jgi:hypothetical protein
MPVGSPERGAPDETATARPLGLETEAAPVNPAAQRGGATTGEHTDNLIDQAFQSQPGQVRINKNTPLPLHVDLRDPSGETFTLDTRTGIMTRHSTGEQTHVDDLAIQRAAADTPASLPDLSDLADGYKPPVDTTPEPPTTAQRAGRVASDLLNLPKALLTSFSLHGAARQGLVLSLTEPVAAIKALGQQFASMFSKSSHDDFVAELANHPETQTARKAGLYLSTLAENVPNRREEFFASRIADQLPGVKQSGRAYSDFLDALRMQSFSKFADELRGAGLTPEQNPAEFEAVARFINSSTGRGELPAALERVAPVLNATLFSSRLMKSRLDLISPKFFLDMPPAARAIAARKMFEFVGTMASTLALARLTHTADVSLDPRDSDFLKLRAGRTHYDVLAGFRGPVKLTAELAQAFADEARGRKVPRGHDPLSVVGRYFRGNLAPVPGASVDYLTGTDIAGRPFKLSREVWQRLAPVFVQAMHAGWKDAGGGGVLKALPAGLGVGTETYQPKEQRDESRPISQSAQPGRSYMITRANILKKARQVGAPVGVVRVAALRQGYTIARG